MRHTGSVRLPRPLHPAAWWIWALGLAVAASRTTNPLLLALILVVVAQVAMARRGDAPWARGFRTYLLLGLFVVGLRIAYRIVLGGSFGTHLLVTLPEVPMPSAVEGIRIGGPVTVEGVLAAAYDGLRLATLLICVGAANVLADPKRLLKSVPSALHELGVAVTVSLSVAPQLVESAQRVHRARRLRGEATRRRHLVRTVLVPVLTDALDRSLLLAAAMDGRGYGRTAGVAPRDRTVAGVLTVLGLMGACCGTYGLLDGTAPRLLGLPMVVLGVTLAAAGLAVSGRRVERSRYRPDPWHGPEWTVSAVGVVVGAVLMVTSRVDPLQLTPSLQPLAWPDLPIVPTVAILAGVAPAWLSPPVDRPGRRPTPPIRPTRTPTAPTAAPPGAPAPVVAR